MTDPVQDRRSLDQALAALAEWAEANGQEVEPVRERWDARRRAARPGRG